ncbi:hypothetical protein BGZ68_009633 [Mortierella alpina]|nr:hypothetical protein BGZ68_009633 [Mortierella alpina]
MNQTKKQSTPFEIAELCSLIASYLEPRDFTRLCLVNKDFSQLFRPFLWSKIVLAKRADCSNKQLPSVEALRSNGHLVEHAELSSWFNSEDAEFFPWYNSEYAKLSFCSKGESNNEGDSECIILENLDYVLAGALLAQCGLRSLKVEDHSMSGRIWHVFMERIRGNRTVENTQFLDGIRTLHICLTYDLFNSKFWPIFTRPHEYPKAVAVFAGVTEFRLHVPQPAEDDQFMGEGCIEVQLRNLVNLFPNLLELSLTGVDILEPHGDTEREFSRSAAVTNCKPLGDYHFRTLDLKYCGISAKQVVHILERSPRVRSLSIGSNPLLGDAEVLADSIPALIPYLANYEQHGFVLTGLSTMLRGLRHLTSVCFNRMRVQDDELQALAESCPLLERLSLLHCRSLSHRGLKLIMKTFTRLISLNLQSTVVSWDIFGQDPAQFTAHDTPTATATAAAPTMPSSLPAACCPWACQYTLQNLVLCLPGLVNNNQLVNLARQRFQSFPKLRSLKLALPVSVLLDPGLKEDRSNARPANFYPALETLDVVFISPIVRLKDTIRIVRSMPKLIKGITKGSFDHASVVWFSGRGAEV